MSQRISISRKLIYILSSIILFISIITIPLLEATAPVWSYQIDGITSLAMSENGTYILIGTNEGYFYLFDEYGTVLKNDYAGGTINTLDISNNGIHFIGTDLGYYISTLDGDPQRNVSRNAQFHAVSISRTGEIIIAGTQKQIYLYQDFSLLHEQYFYDVNEEFKEKNEIQLTDISASGLEATAASRDTIALFFYSMGEWQFISCEQMVSSLAISDDGSMCGWGTEDGEIRIFSDAYESKFTHIWKGNERIHDIIFTADGKYLLGCTSHGDIFFLEADGKVLWEDHVMNTLDAISISQNGDLIAIGGETLCLMNKSGVLLQKIAIGEQLHHVFVSGNGQYICCSSDDTVFFYKVFPSYYRSSWEYEYASRKSYPHKDSLQETNLLDRIEVPQTVLTGDVNGDGKIELIIGLEKRILITDTSGTLLTQIPLDTDTQLRQVLDVTGDYVPEIIIGNLHILTLIFYDGEGTLLAHHNFSQAWDLPPDHKGILTPLFVDDIDKDEKLEVISLVSAGYSIEPRGIYVFEYPSFSTQWFYSYAPQVGSTTIADLDDDGQVEILIGSNNPCNIADSNGESDCLASVVAISSQGKKLWSKEVGYGFRRAIIDCTDVDGDGQVEIICSGWSFEDNWGTLFILDKNGEYIRGEGNEFDHSIYLRNVADLDHDGKKEIIAFLTGGCIVIFDHMLNQIHEEKLDINTDRFTHFIVNDIDADGDKELIVASNDDVIYILDGNLAVEHMITLPESLDYGLISIANLGGCKNDLIVPGKKLHIFSFQNDKESGPCPLWARTERILQQEGTEYMTEGITLFSAGNYRGSLGYLIQARENFEKVEDEENVSLLTEKIMIASEKIFKQNIWIIMVAFALWDGIFFLLLLYYCIFKKVWIKTSERVVLLTLPLLLGLVNVYHAEGQYVYVFIMYCFPSYAIATTIVLRENVIGFMRTLASILSGHKDMLVLSIMRADGSYRVSVESIEERFMPVKESKSVSFPSTTKEDLIQKIRFMVETLGYYYSHSTPVPHDYGGRVETLEEIGTTIYSTFIPEDFSEILQAKFLLLEMEDTEIPWELMYSDTFFALEYAISRRIVTTESVTTRKKLIPGKKALIICDPTGTLKDARPECDIVYDRLNRKMDTVFLHDKGTTKVKLANHLAQGYDIIHFAGHVDNGIVVSDGTMSFDEVKECIVGTPVVFVNGCRSEELARSFLIGGAIAYVGMIHPVHDRWAAEIAVDFYDLCFQYRVGEALRRARLKNVEKSIVWASLIMYGDPTMKLF